MKKIVFLSVGLFLTGCTVHKEIVVKEIRSDNLMVEGKLFTAFFQQQAAEYRALCIQSYNLARIQLDEALKIPLSRPGAIITDIDETLLDNSRYAVHQALQQKGYDINSWAEWTAMSAADTISGAVGFLNYAKSKGVEVFYITNREERERQGTLQNLVKFNFPYADNEHLILKSTTSSKEVRRQSIASKYEIVLLLGDNLADFSSLFDKKSADERLANVMLQSTDFGKKFIIIPNPSYGDWEGAAFKYIYTLTDFQKDSVIKVNLKNY